MTKDEARLSVMGAISMALKDPILQQGFEIICKNLSELEQENKLAKSLLYCTVESCDNCGNCNCENFQRQRKSVPCELYVSYQDRIKQLEKQIEKMKSDSKTAYIKGIRTMANALKEYDRTNGAWTDYFEHTVDKVLKNLLKE